MISFVKCGSVPADYKLIVNLSHTIIAGMFCQESRPLPFVFLFSVLRKKPLRLRCSR